MPNWRVFGNNSYLDFGWDVVGYKNATMDALSIGSYLPYDAVLYAQN